eukprot:scaffold20442_cov51-Attheya_sp.AAC.1
MLCTTLLRSHRWVSLTALSLKREASSFTFCTVGAMGFTQEIQKREQREAAERAKRIETNLQAANATDRNLLSGLEPFVTFDYERQQDENVDAFKRKAHISFYSSPLPDNLHRDCMELFERNMGDMYRSSIWGLNMEEKDEEFRHKDASK